MKLFAAITFLLIALSTTAQTAEQKKEAEFRALMNKARTTQVKSLEAQKAADQKTIQIVEKTVKNIQKLKKENTELKKELSLAYDSLETVQADKADESASAESRIKEIESRYANEVRLLNEQKQHIILTDQIVLRDTVATLTRSIDSARVVMNSYKAAYEQNAKQLTQWESYHYKEKKLHAFHTFVLGLLMVVLASSN